MDGQSPHKGDAVTTTVPGFSLLRLIKSPLARKAALSVFVAIPVVVGMRINATVAGRLLDKFGTGAVFGLALLCLGILGGCASSDEETAPEKPSYVFNVSGADDALATGRKAEATGNAAAAIAAYRQAAKMYPVFEETYEAMAATAQLAGDEDSLRFARFFAARLGNIDRLGPYVAALHFDSAGKETATNNVKDPAVRAQARRVSAYLKAVMCNADRERIATAEEQVGFVRRYGVEGIIGQLRRWFEELPNECPDVTFK